MAYRSKPAHQLVYNHGHGVFFPRVLIEAGRIDPSHINILMGYHDKGLVRTKIALQIPIAL